jgi:elongation factor Ts
MSINLIKKLREQTGLSIAECKKALEAAEGDLEKATEALREKSKEMADKKAAVETKEGIIHAYVHSNGKIGVMIELNCQTDFVARNHDFKNLANDLAMQIAALDPPDLETLLSQNFVKEPSKTIADIVSEAIARIGENIKIARFVRYQI